MQSSSQSAQCQSFPSTSRSCPYKKPRYCQPSPFSTAFSATEFLWTRASPLEVCSSRDLKRACILFDTVWPIKHFSCTWEISTGSAILPQISFLSTGSVFALLIIVSQDAFAPVVDCGSCSWRCVLIVSSGFRIHAFSSWSSQEFPHHYSCEVCPSYWVMPVVALPSQHFQSKLYKYCYIVTFFEISSLFSIFTWKSTATKPATQVWVD